ncbi:MAG TPA: hypothetical protein VF657_13210 [Actinoplanes sp.]
MDALDAFVSNILTASADTPSPFGVGTVTAITAAGGADGADMVTVDWRGTELDLWRLDSYTPTVGDRVLLARFGSQLIVLGRPAGGPSSAQL